MKIDDERTVSQPHLAIDEALVDSSLSVSSNTEAVPGVERPGGEEIVAGVE